MLIFYLATLLALLPAIVSAAIFPPDTKVKMLDPKGFRRAMRSNRTSVVAFVAPWCGHCQRMVPEYSKAAENLSPLIPFYAVDCDAEMNKRLCGEQGVQGFPTLKVFPRGSQAPPESYDSGERTSGKFIRWASRSVPNNVQSLPHIHSIPAWLDKTSDLPRVILLNKDKKFPLLWQVFANNYRKKMAFGHHTDPDGAFAASLGFPATVEGKTSKVIVYPPGSSVAVLYEGMTKYDPLTKFFRSILDGSADFLQTSSEQSVRDEL
ncbi:thioredoxin-like protein [Suillus clintonianus]|uniref:thioredoxin-like protein n=1 Tax=Suillus clintonianus TaxID=1904413 RepID=UPI001B85DCF8|nr:thioredoxin-like protein [Suillus clintonianus]KAG2144324.1 thioredoxin-like protein [Suillus clintonianus]